MAVSLRLCQLQQQLSRLFVEVSLQGYTVSWPWERAGGPAGVEGGASGEGGWVGSTSSDSKPKRWEGRGEKGCGGEEG